MLPNVILCYIMSCNLMMLSYVRSCHIMSCHVIFSHLILSHAMLCNWMEFIPMQCVCVHVTMYVHVYTLGWQSCRCPKIIGPDNRITPHVNNFTRLRLSIEKQQGSKTRGRAARHQAACVDPPDVIILLEAVFGKFPGNQKLWQQSLRRRVADLLTGLGLPTKRVSGSRPFDLGSLRPGGATFLLMEYQDPERVRRQGRWVKSKVMDIYVQEVMYTAYTEELSHDAKLSIQQLASAFPTILSKAVKFLNAAIPPSTWLRLYHWWKFWE